VCCARALLFFFSSRTRHTRSLRDWSSDVCSSDLWVAAISVAVAIGVAVTPHLSGIKFMVAIITQLQQTSSILTLCLLLFVCFAIRPMGLSYKSRIFGVSLGLGILATVNLVNAAWLTHSPNMYSTISMVYGLADGL